MRDTYQVVFLIDVSSGTKSTGDEGLLEKNVSCVRLSVLKLLTYFATQISPDPVSKYLRWGCKFYNPATRLSEKINFCEFDLSNFEDFENRLENIFESDRKEQADRLQRKRADAQLDYDSVGSVKENEDIDPGKSLKENLTAVLHDFQWDRPEITSPVRPSFQRRGSKKFIDEPKYHNFLWLIGDCPHTVDDVRKYTLCGVKHDSDAILSYILPPAVFSQFYAQRRIRLFWLDFAGTLACKADGGLPGLESVHNALSHTEGGVMPLGAIIKLASPVSTPILNENIPVENLPSEIENRQSCSDLMLPLNTLLRHYIPMTVAEKVPPAAACNGVLKLQGVNGSWSGSILLSPMSVGLRGYEGLGNLSTSVGKGQGGASLSLTLPTTSVKENGPRHGQPLWINYHDHAAACPSHVQGDGEHLLQCRGTLQAGGLPLDTLQSDLVYMVTLGAPGPGSSQSGHFYKILEYLSRNSLVLVVDSIDPFSHLPLLGILRPLTSVSATLTLVRSDISLCVEKLLLFGGLSGMISHGANTIEKAMDGSVEVFMRPFMEADSKQTSDVRLPCSSGPVATLRPNWLSDWVSPHIAANATKTLIEGIRKSTDPSAKEEENTIMRKLLEHRHQRTLVTKPVFEASTPSRRRSPRKAVKRSHKQFSPRKSPRKTPGRAGVKRKPGSVTVMGRSRSFTAPVNSRCAYIFKKSKEVVAQKKDDPEVGELKSDSRGPSSRQSDVAVQGDFKSTEELVSHMQAMYDQAVEGDRGTFTCVQYVVSVALHYVKSTEQEDPQTAIVKLFQEHFLQSANQIRNKYSQAESHSNSESKLFELQLQLLLRMELQSLSPPDGEEEDNVDKVVQEVVTMLRSLSFLKDTGFLNDYLQEVLLENYVSSIPRFLYLVYEELLQPLPPQLAGMFSPTDTDGAPSVQPPSNASSTFSDLSSCRSADVSSTRSTRSKRSLKSFSSFNVGRQITIPARQKQSKNGEKEKVKTRSSARKKSPKEGKGGKSEVRKVRRNLFTESGMPSISRKSERGGGLFTEASKPSTGRKSERGGGLERHQSVAVMEGIGHTPRTPRRSPRKLPTKPLRTPKSHHILKTRTVLETPTHKQKRNATWRKQEATRRRTHTLSEVDVVQESPDKVIREAKTEGNPLRALSRRASLGLCKRKSFYSTAPETKSRNVEKYYKYSLLEARMASKALSPKSKEQVRNTPPRRINPMMFSQLASPSPPRRIGTVFSQIGSPSPLKTHSVSFHSQQTVDTILSTPSKHTRSRTASSLFTTPSKNTRSHSVQSPVLHSHASPSKLTSLSSSVDYLLRTPTRAFGLLKDVKQSPCMTSPTKGILKSIGKEVGQCRNTNLQTPPRRAVKRINLDSPIKADREGSLGSWKQETSDNTKLPFSPSRLTRSHTNSTMSGDNLILDTQHPAGNFSGFSSMTDSGLDVTKSPDRTRASNKRKRKTKSSSSESEKENMDGSCNDSMLSPRRSQRLERGGESEGHSPEEHNIHTTPSSKLGANKRILRTPDTLNQWPRRKPRPLLHSPKTPHKSPDKAPGKDSWAVGLSPSSGVSEMDKSLPESCNSSQAFEDVNSIISSPGLRRRIAKRHKGHAKGPSGTPSSVANLRTETSERLDGQSNITTGKRKRSMDSDITEDFKPGTPLKKYKRSDPSVGNSEDYFSSQEVFIEANDNACHYIDPLPMAEDNMAGQSSSNPNAQTPGVPSENQGCFESNCHKDFTAAYNDRIRQVLSGSSDSNSNLAAEFPPQPRSPVFKHSGGLLKNHSSGIASEISNDSVGLPSSPVLTRHVDTLLQRLGSEDSVTGNSPQQLRCSPVISPSSSKKYSPVCARSLAHLISSPLLTDSQKAKARTAGQDEQIATNSPGSSVGQRRGSRSRRSLMYRSESKMHL